MLRLTCTFFVLVSSIDASPWLNQVHANDLLGLQKLYHENADNIFTTNEQQQTAADIAAREKNTEMLDWLLSTEPSLLKNKDSDGNTVLHHAVDSGSRATVQTVLSHERKQPLIAFLETNSEQDGLQWGALLTMIAQDVVWEWVEENSIERGVLNSLKQSKSFEKAFDLFKRKFNTQQ